MMPENGQIFKIPLGWDFMSIAGAGHYLDCNGLIPLCMAETDMGVTDFGLDDNLHPQEPYQFTQALDTGQVMA